MIWLREVTCGAVHRIALAWGLLAANLAVALDRGVDVFPSPQAAAMGMGGPSGSACRSASGSPTVDQLVRLSREELDAIYRQAPVAAIPAGKVRGTAIFRPGTALASPMSKTTKLLWQGKVFDPEDGTALNRFLGIKTLKANVYVGESWVDGGPALILDYSETSLLYARNRDEIRQIGPGRYLGVMYARTCPRPTFKMYFVLETRCAGR